MPPGDILKDQVGMFLHVKAHWLIPGEGQQVLDKNPFSFSFSPSLLSDKNPLLLSKYQIPLL